MVPQVFTKPGNDATATMNLMVTSMSTSAIFKKLEDEYAANMPAGGDGSKKGTESSKTAKGKQAPKAKAKKRTQKKGKDDLNQTGDDENEDENPTPWSNMVYQITDSSGIPECREKTALDDFMHCFLEIIKKANKQVARNSTGSVTSSCPSKVQEAFKLSSMSVFAHAASCFLEFTFTGSVCLNGKYVRNYTQFRPELQTFVSTAFDMAVTATSSNGPKGMPLFGENVNPMLGAAPMGHLKDESDEVKAIDRIRLASPIAVRNGMQEFVTNALVLPLEYHADFVKDSNSFFATLCGRQIDSEEYG